MWLSLSHPPLGTWPATQACDLTGNQTGNPLACRPALNPLSHPARALLHFLRDAKFPLRWCRPQAFPSGALATPCPHCHCHTAALPGHQIVWSFSDICISPQAGTFMEAVRRPELASSSLHGGGLGHQWRQPRPRAPCRAWAIGLSVADHALPEPRSW